MSEVQEIFERLISVLETPAPGRIADPYLARVAQCIRQAMHPEQVIEETMLFRGGNTADYRIIHDADEEAQALAEGFTRTFNPGPAGFPKHFAENSRRNGVYNSGYRRVCLRTPAEWTRFCAHVEIADWTEDPNFELGGIGTALSDLEEEHRNKIKAMVDRDEIEIMPEPAADVERDRANDSLESSPADDSAAAAETRGN